VALLNAVSIILANVSSWKGFCSAGRSRYSSGRARGAISGREDEGAVACLDQFGNRRNHLAVDVDVENGEVELGGLRQPDRLVDFAGLGRDAVAEFLQHVSNHHPDHDLVLDEEH